MLLYVGREMWVGAAASGCRARSANIYKRPQQREVLPRESVAIATSEALP